MIVLRNKATKVEKDNNGVVKSGHSIGWTYWRQQTPFQGILKYKLTDFDGKLF